MQIEFLISGWDPHYLCAGVVPDLQFRLIVNVQVEFLHDLQFRLIVSVQMELLIYSWDPLLTLCAGGAPYLQLGLIVYALCRWSS